MLLKIKKCGFLSKAIIFASLIYTLPGWPYALNGILEPFLYFTSVNDLRLVKRVYGRCPFTLFPRNYLVDLVELGMLDLDVTLSIDGFAHMVCVLWMIGPKWLEQYGILECVLVINFLVRWQWTTISSYFGLDINIPENHTSNEEPVCP